MHKSSEIIIADNNITNPKLKEKSKYMVFVKSFGELYELSITNLSKSDEKEYICLTQDESSNTTSNTSFSLFLKSMYV